MRNVLVHDYLDIDYLDIDHAMVSAAIPLAQERYGAYVRRVARWLRDRMEKES